MAFGERGLVPRPRRLRLPPELAGYHCAVVGGHAASGQAATGSGFARTSELAQAKAVGEYVERASLLAPRPSSLMTAQPGIAVEGALGSRDVPYFSVEQIAAAASPWQGLRPDDRHQWHPCRGLGPTPDRFLPADLVWLDRPSSIALLGSSGAAAHPDLEAAQLNGLLELIERDALSAMWETRALTPIIGRGDARRAGCSDDLLDRLEGAGQRVLLRDLTTDLGIPVVAAVVFNDRGDRPALAMGAAARLDLGAAVDAAIAEAAAVWAWMRDEHARLTLSIDAVAALARMPASPKWQAVLYGFPEMLGAAAPLTATAPHDLRRSTVDRREGPGSLDGVIRRLAAAGIPCWWTSILPSEWVGTGWNAVRVLAPALAPLAFGEVCRPLGHPRVLNVARACGWPHRPPSPGQNRPPIPLP